MLMSKRKRATGSRLLPCDAAGRGERFSGYGWGMTVEAIENVWANRVLDANPSHPSVHLERVGEFWPGRVTDACRALALQDENALIRVWIGSHVRPFALFCRTSCLTLIFGYDSRL